MKPEPAKRATEFPLDMADFKLCRPFHGLAIVFTLDPSAQALGYSHTVRYRGRRPTPIFGQSR